MTELILTSLAAAAHDAVEERPGVPAPAPITPQLCRSARLSLGWTTEELAVAAGLSPPTIVQFENELRTPRLGTVIALRKALRRAGAIATTERGSA